MNGEESFKERIAAAAPRRLPPVGLETRIMAQVRLRERRRRERRTIAAMALYCAGVSVVLIVVLCTGMSTLDLREQWPVALVVLAGTLGLGFAACYDRFNAALRKL